jgi:hypothetical protein
MRQKTFDVRSSVLVCVLVRSKKLIDIIQARPFDRIPFALNEIALLRKRFHRIDYSSTAYDQIVAKGIEATIKPTMNPFR